MWLLTLFLACGSTKSPRLHAAADANVAPSDGFTPHPGVRSIEITKRARRKASNIQVTRTTLARIAHSDDLPGAPFPSVTWMVDVPDSWIIDFLGQEAYAQCEARSPERLCWTHPFPCARLSMDGDLNYLLMWTGDCTAADPTHWRYGGISGPEGEFRLDPASVPLLAMDQDAFPVMGW